MMSEKSVCDVHSYVFAGEQNEFSREREGEGRKRERFAACEAKKGKKKIFFDPQNLGLLLEKVLSGGHRPAEVSRRRPWLARPILKFLNAAAV